MYIKPLHCILLFAALLFKRRELTRIREHVCHVKCCKFKRLSVYRILSSAPFALIISMDFWKGKTCLHIFNFSEQHFQMVFHGTLGVPLEFDKILWEIKGGKGYLNAANCWSLDQGLWEILFLNYGFFSLKKNWKLLC